MELMKRIWAWLVTASIPLCPKCKAAGLDECTFDCQGASTW